jgi:hypothetical protein
MFGEGYGDGRDDPATTCARDTDAYYFCLGAAIGAEHIAVRLVRGEAGELIVIVWPTRATEIDPAALPATTRQSWRP